MSEASISPAAALPKRILLPLAFVNFTIGAGAFLVLGLLAPITDSLSLTKAQAGWVMGAYALAYAISSPIVIAMTGAWARRSVILIGLGLFVAALNVRFRDTAVILEVVLQAWFFLTPVVYDMRVLPEAKNIMGMDVEIRRWAYILNPIGSLIASYRDILYWTTPPGLDFVARTAVESAIILVVGYLFFNRLAPTFGEDV